MKTTLDEFHDELDKLCEKYGYVISSVREDIVTDLRTTHNYTSSAPISIFKGIERVELYITGMRLQKS